MSAKIRNFSILALAGLLLASCAATSFPTFVKPGTTADRVSRDSAACDIEANRLFPAANFPVVFPYATVGYYPGAWGWGGGATVSNRCCSRRRRVTKSKLAASWQARLRALTSPLLRSS